MAKGRRGHLLNLLEGLSRGTRLPEECILVDMDETPAPLPSLPFPLHHLHHPSCGLPLAEARNRAARTARQPVLVFLDVDCIPATGLVEALARDALAHDALICCEIRYLPAGATSGDSDWEESGLLARGLRHTVRHFPESGIRPEPNTGLFWSLCFAIRRETFLRLGGFDEGYAGYGAEDTDFAFRARDAGVGLLFTASTLAFHQHHTVYDPPLQHFGDILRNAERFRERHGFWPMDGWLADFARLGLIEPPGPGPLRVLRHPTEEEIARAACGPERAY
ncbi:galactosyltransferase-related protein [Roseomonas gilardii subsp. gilardii]|uniref:glycosyltransferase n=1 Tax=Roseomonas gilardii TaxID=257708 RepID=UPI001FFBDCCD|nr:glycosyltransferase [Roseomonas gilardii]UPG74106.1 galactosyltransferase-related protein [Roseomonas gilardii subsp. gilardii]